MTYRIHHIPVCPFSQRVEILLALKGLSGKIEFNTVDITKPRDPALLKLSKGTAALPVMEVPGGLTAIKESRVILRYVDEVFDTNPIRRTDPYEHALESLLVQREGGFVVAGYSFVMNQDIGKRGEYLDKLLAEYRAINDILVNYAPGDIWFFDDFGWAETVFTPIFMRFWFLDYYEGFDLPPGPDYDRVRAWREACLTHPAAQQVSFDEIVKLYYDYAKGAGNGALLPGREYSSFVFEPHWKDRPMPPSDKYGHSASDTELGLV
ncbi:glutathione S-transferase family protein [Alphaproteobacteria bacterium GH1-50]|uniref:Glutathione S-transferase family protein n=1 Tax=Kangsaoukella pontilimi TaxID=2691042 RepID=A0A7C9MEH1_9RHOB|nr:glutathione S-transferase family protein [Kangsaoukella pontilimi]MXQ08831.1 glutathione S-transferase family protein [Kangsaoukella pontilimi]